MKNFLFLLCTFAYLIFANTHVASADNSSTFNYFSTIPWEYIDQSDSWGKFGFEGQEEVFLGIKNDKAAVTFAIQTRCDSGDHRLRLITWSAGEQTGVLYECDQVKHKDMFIESFMQESFCPLPREIQDILGQKTHCST